MDSEDRLSPIAWVMRGDGHTRTRSYRIDAHAQRDEIVGALGSVISKNVVAAHMVSNTGFGSKMVAGSVADGGFWARLYDPDDYFVAHGPG